jgi:ferredoxin
MDCFYQDERMLYIDPVECIDCDGCVAECPVEAIYHETNVPAPWQSFIALNAERAATLKAQGGPITERQAPLTVSGCSKASRLPGQTAS